MGWQDILKQWDWEWLVNVFREGIEENFKVLGTYRSWKGSYINFLNLLYEGDKDKIGKYIEQLIKSIDNPTFSKIRIAKIKIQHQPELFLPPVLREAKTVVPNMSLRWNSSIYQKENLSDSFYITEFSPLRDPQPHYIITVQVEDVLILCLSTSERDWKFEEVVKMVGKNYYMVRSYQTNNHFTEGYQRKQGPFVSETTNTLDEPKE
mgnify:FL=1|tara:strand:- start:911 stop:1531 length:621 start_codon:yes stop_codon:yes gene_type:complete